MTEAQPRRSRVVSAVAGLAIVGVLLVGSSSLGSALASAVTPRAALAAAPGQSHAQREIALYTGMRQLWSDHMQWTYATVDAFFHHQASLQPTLARLLQNQKDLGAAIVPFFGQAAGDQLGALLTTHILEAVPVLQAAQAGDQAALTTAVDAWFANAKQIADFLTAADPKDWPASATEPMMHAHISQTITYSVDLLKGDYAQAIKDYDVANDHMAMMADFLSAGIVAQFPSRLTP